MKNHVCIMVDTGSDMLPEEAEKLNIRLLPLNVRFGTEEFEDGFTISRDEFYNRLEKADVIPKTSLISPQRYSEYFSEAVSAGQDVVCLTLSSGISGSYQSAKIAAADFGGWVHVVDTLQFCGTEYLLAQRAAELRDRGADAGVITATLEQEKLKPRVVALFDSLRYLKLGGRISPAVACIGEALNIKPVLTIRKGEVALIGKARGARNGHNHLMNFVQQHGGIDWNKPVLLSWAGNSDELLEKYIANSAALYTGHDPAKLPRSRVGATIGTYCGPNSIAFSFYPLGR